MANICDACGQSVHRVRFSGGKFLGVDCHCLQERRRSVEAPAVDMTYDGLVLEHVHGEDGKPLRVTSSRQLARAEQQFDFISVVRNMEAQNFNDAPQQRRFEVGDFYKRKFRGGAG